MAGNPQKPFNSDPKHFEPNPGNNNQEKYSTTIKIVGIIATLFIMVALALIAVSTFSALFSLTLPSLVRAFTVFSSELSMVNCLKLALEGLIAGFFIGCIKRVFVYKSTIVDKVLSKLFSLQVLEVKPSYSSSIILSLLVGVVVGWITAAGGAVGVTTLVSADIHNVASNILHSTLPIVAFLKGGAGGFFSSFSFLWIVLIILIFVINGILIGAASGVTFGAVAGAINGAVRGGVLKSMVSLVSAGDSSDPKAEIMWKSAQRGTIEGAMVGGIVGFIQGVTTVMVFYGEK